MMVSGLCDFCTRPALFRVPRATPAMARFSRFAAAAACALALPGLAQGFGWGSSGAAASATGAEPDGRQLLAEAVRVEKEGAVEEEDGRASQEFYGAAIAGWGWRAGWPKRRVKFPQRTQV